ncbi:MULTISPECIES: VirB4-like conjugal transfer ATPase, CD1110 family [Bifidobacterium]|uniref:Type IV secretory pathway VirB4 component protein n=2 Tax=Bifidobacterium TaxID=1678 RepID=A0A261FUP6_9BIFI|nr:MULTISPECIES: type IV secretion system protein VirB4 [Bifidobacterium]OZG62486.1 type IV secretory pathway VirB4 component protein [Bifidobacterium lemurum]OZG69022.1 type IV secretory pathway VirB4 component protein [Bifidobacterium eulemuris]QOL31450.1 type IV secretion system protein VirB4 [Bifidobacterium eulemuris]QOL33827.1 type IV secretion system protein VirB4 [Bifidobacterium lemurum]
MRKKEKSEKEASRQGAPRSVKELVAYDALLPGGQMYLGGDVWSVSLRLGDINYAIATQDQQLDIVDRWGQILNSVGNGVSVEETIMTRTLDPERVSAQITMAPAGDGHDDLREDFNRNVRRQLSGSSKSTVTDKYLTFSLSNSDHERAINLLNRQALSVQSQLRSLYGCEAVKLNRRERLRVLHSLLRRGTRFTFDEDDFAARRHASTKDYACPWAVDMRDKRRLTIDDGDVSMLHQVLYVSDFPDYLSDQLIADLTDIKADITVSVHLTPEGKAEGLKLVNRKIAEMEMQAADERSKNRKRHQPDDYLPHDLSESMDEAAEMRDDLKHQGERLVSSLVVIDVCAETEERLDRLVRDVIAVIDAQSCVADTLTYMQGDALNAVLPLGVNPLPMRRTLTTSGAAILLPFTTQELFQAGGVMAGTNARSGNAVVYDRAQNMNANGFILGTAGSGKSQAAKNEITQIFLTRPDDDLVVIDPEHEFTPLCMQLGGERIEIGESSPSHINALDIELLDDSEGDPIRSKCAAALNMIGALIGGDEGMDKVARALIDRCLMTLYRDLRDGKRLLMPTLADLRDMLESLDEERAHEAAQALEIYTAGSLNAFAHPTDVDVRNRMVVYDVSGLGAELKTFGMMVVLDQVWNRVVRNRAQGRRTWLWVDEFHMLFSNPFAADYFLRLYKRGRKWGLGVTGITQNIEELLLNDEARLMLSNSSFLLLMNQTATDAAALCELLKLSDEQREFFTGVQPGQGMLKSAESYIPFDGRIDTSSRLYRLFSTKFGEE